MKRLLSVFFILSFAAPLVSQQRNETPSPREQERMTKAVRHELIMLPYFGVFDNISFQLDGRTVTLMGQVARPILKSDAEGVVKHVEGVEQVINQIEILPNSPVDDRLRRRLFRAIYGYPAMHKYAVVPQKPSASS